MKFKTISRLLAAGSALAALLTAPVPALAQDANAEARLRRIEQEVRALQRQVFPGGDGRYFEPEISNAQAPRPAESTPPATTAVTDILARMDAVESSLQRLTAQSEENANALRILTTRVAALEGTGTPAAAAPAATTPAPSAATPAPASQAARPATQPAGATPAPVARPSAERLARVQAIAKPQTGDAGDDEYSYGFRLWEAGLFPEAQQQLTMFVERYPSHARISFGRNLLGRAYLDDNKPREAAPWFLRNYQSDRNGARAADSLLFLGESMIAMQDTNRACIALAEFSENYPAVAAGRLASQYQAARGRVRCPA